MTGQVDQVFAEIQKSDPEAIRVAPVTFKGRVGVDIRVYARYRATGEVGSTKSGLRIAPEKLPELMAARSLLASWPCRADDR
jgi:hypothetical protein